MADEHGNAANSHEKSDGRQTVRRCVLRMAISEMAMNTGTIAIMTAAMPDGTRRSAQNSSP